MKIKNKEKVSSSLRVSHYASSAKTQNKQPFSTMMLVQPRRPEKNPLQQTSRNEIETRMTNYLYYMPIVPTSALPAALPEKQADNWLLH